MYLGAKLNKKIELFSLALILLVFFGTCRQSEFLRKRYVDFNFIDEGFVSPSLLQTLGRASYKSEKGGSDKDEALCLKLAQRKARKRLLRVILHTHFRISSRNSFDKERGKPVREKTAFEKDYPFSFSDDELLQAELAFQPFLQRAFIALQDSRDPKQCMVLYRVTGENLPEEIQQMKPAFKL